MHALERIWTALAPNGMLVDVRPVAARWPLEIVGSGRVARAGRVDDSPNTVDDRAADAAMHAVERGGLFRRIDQATFPFSYLWDSVEEMTVYVAANMEDWVILPDRLLARARELEREARGERRVRITLRMIMRTYARLDEPQGA